MAKVRTDAKGRTVQKGEIQEQSGRYIYSYTDQTGKAIEPKPFFESGHEIETDMKGLPVFLLCCRRISVCGT